MGVITFKLEGDEAKAVAAFLKVVDAQKKTEDGSRQIHRQSVMTSDALTGMARAGLAEMTAWVGSIASVTAAAALAKQMFTDLAAERRRAAEDIRKEAPGAGRLAQLAGGDPGKMRAMMEEADRSRREHGLTADEAHNLQFALMSMGEEKEREYFAGFKGIADPRGLVESVSTIKAAFGEGPTGGTRAIANRMIAAAGLSKTTIEQFGPAVTIAAQTTREIGGTDAELLGTMAIMSRATKDADVAGTQVAALEKTLIKQGLGGKGILAGVDRIQKVIDGLDPKKAIKLFADNAEDLTAAAGMTDEQLEEMMHGKMKPEDIPKFFGRLEGFKGYRLIQLQRGAIDQAVAEIAKEGQFVGEGDLAERTKAAFLAQPSLAAVKAGSITAQQLEMGREGVLGIPQLTREQTIDAEMLRSYQRGDSGLRRWFKKKAMGIEEFFDSSPADVRRAARSLDAPFADAFNWTDTELPWTGKASMEKEEAAAITARIRAKNAARAATQPAPVIQHFHGDMYSWEFDLSKRPTSRPVVEID
jgi:hypothetical protein